MAGLRAGTTRRRNLVALLVVGLGASAGGYFLAPEPRARHVVDAVPEGAFLVITVDIDRVRRSGLMDDLGSVRRPELDDLSRACGFDPLDHAREAVIAVPEGGEPGDFGVAVSVDLSCDQIVTCARQVIAGRGATASVREEEGYTIVEDESPESKHAQLAMRAGSPLFIGRGAWLRQVRHAFDGRVHRASAQKDGHTQLRDTVAARDSAVTASALLPPELRRNFRDEVALGQKAAGPTFNAVLAVRAIAVALHAGDDAGGDGLEASVSCDTEEACATLRDFAEKKRSALAGDFGMRLIGLGALLEHARVELRPRELRISANASARAMARIVNLGLGAGAAANPATSRVPRPALAAPIVPDETLSVPARDR